MNEPSVKLQDLSPGTVLRHRLSGNGYIVTVNHGGRVIATRTIDVRNPAEWVVVHHATGEEIPVTP